MTGSGREIPRRSRRATVLLGLMWLGGAVVTAAAVLLLAVLGVDQGFMSLTPAEGTWMVLWAIAGIAVPASVTSWESWRRLRRHRAASSAADAAEPPGPPVL